MKRFWLFLCLLVLLSVPAEAAIRRADFSLTCEAMQRAHELDLQSHADGHPQGWISILALAAARSSGNPSASDVTAAYRLLREGHSPADLSGKAHPYYLYYKEVYTAVLSGLTCGSDGEIAAYFPVAAGYPASCSDGGSTLALTGVPGTPVVAVERGTVEACSKSRDGCCITVRSDDGMRCYEYAHLQSDAPFAPALAAGCRVEAGQVLGFMGEADGAACLRFGVRLAALPNGETAALRIDACELLRFLSAHTASVVCNSTTRRWETVPAFSLSGACFRIFS